MFANQIKLGSIPVVAARPLVRTGLFFALISAISLVFVPAARGGWATTADAGGVTITVDTTIDSNAAAYRACTDATDDDCSLRGAITKANTDVGTAYIINVPAGTYTLTIEGDSENNNATGDLDASGLITLAGSGAAVTIIQAGPNDLEGIDRVLHLVGTAEVTIQDVTLQHGFAIGSGPQGGAINATADTTLYLSDSIVNRNRGDGGALNNEGTSYVNNTLFTYNYGDGSGGAIRNWWTGAVITVEDSTFITNYAQWGGTISNALGVVTLNRIHISDSLGMYGGAIQNSDVMTINSSTIVDNHALNVAGGIYLTYGSLTVNESTIAGNSSDGSGGGIYVLQDATLNLNDSTLVENSSAVDGGGIYNLNVVNIANSTFSGNSAGDGFGGAIYNEEAAYISSSTFAGNSAFAGGAIGGGTGTVGLQNSILADSGGGECTGSLVFSGGNNLIDDATCGNDPSFRLGAVTLLDPVLQDNGGPTETHALLPGSNAVDAVVNCSVVAGSTAPPPYQSGAPIVRDQRDVPRPLGPMCDVGSFEMALTAVAFSQAAYADDEGVGVSMAVTLMRTGIITDTSEVEVAITGGTAVSGTDYIGTSFPQSVTFAEGETSQVISIPFIEDTEGEGDETIVLAVTALSGAAIGEPDTTTLTILDNDTSVAFSEASYDDDEAAGVSLAVNLVRAGGLTVESAVEVSVSGGTAISGTDYVGEPFPLTVLFEVGETSKVVPITLTNDVIDEDDETIALVVTAISNSIIGEPGAAVLTITDNDTAAVDVSPVSGLETSEAGGSDTFTVVLETQPTADVTITVASSDESEGTVSTTEVAFTPSNWDEPQSVTVTGVDDAQDDGDVSYPVIVGPIASDDSKYEALNPADVAVTNLNDDQAAIALSSMALTVSEPAGTAVFSVTLGSEPTADVVINLTPSNSECMVDTNVITLTAANWQTGVLVTVTAVDDEEQDGEQLCMLVTAPAASDDTNYEGMDAADVTITVLDDDNAWMILLPFASNK